MNAKQKSMKTKEEYIESLAAELKEWSAEIDVLAGKAEHVASDVARKYNDEIEVLRLKQRAAATKMNELKESGGDAWESIKETADNIWDDLKSGVASVAAKFK